MGRDEDLGELIESFRGGAASLVSVVGEPGLGKSRLLREFAAHTSARDAQIVTTRCEAHTAHVPLRVLSRMMRAVFGVRLLDAAAARQHIISQLGDLAEPGSDEIAVLFDVMAIGDAAMPMPTKNTAARRHMLIELISSAMKARRARTVFIVEDVHWVDAASDEFLAELAAMLRSTDSMLRELPAGIPRPTAQYVGNDHHALPTRSVDHRRPRGPPDRGAAHCIRRR